MTATGFPTPTLTENGALPGGVTFDSGTGILSGTPAAGAGGIYPLTFTADNGTGSNATQNFTLTINQGPPSPVPTRLRSLWADQCIYDRSHRLPNREHWRKRDAAQRRHVRCQYWHPRRYARSWNERILSADFHGRQWRWRHATQSFTLLVSQALAITSASKTTLTVGMPVPSRSQSPASRHQFLAQPEPCQAASRSMQPRAFSAVRPRREPVELMP